MKNGVLNCWADYFQDIWNWFIWSTISGWPESVRSIQVMLIKWMSYHWLKKAFQKESEWQTCVLLVHIKLTVSHIYILNWWSTTYSRNSTRYSQTNLLTKQTVLQPEDGFYVQIQDLLSFTLNIWELMNGFWIWADFVNWKNTSTILNSETNGEQLRNKTK